LPCDPPTGVMRDVTMPDYHASMAQSAAVTGIPALARSPPPVTIKSCAMRCGMLDTSAHWQFWPAGGVLFRPGAFSMPVSVRPGLLCRLRPLCRLASAFFSRCGGRLRNTLWRDRRLGHCCLIARDRLLHCMNPVSFHKRCRAPKRRPALF